MNIMQAIMTNTTPEVNEWPLIKVFGCDFRPMLKDMADTVDRLQLWNWFKDESPPGGSGYMYWGHPNIELISNGLIDNQHSGATFGFAMRCMQSISKNGFDGWKKLQKQPE